MKQITHKSRKSSLSHHRDRQALEKRRLKAAKYFQAGKTPSQVARLLNVSAEGARQWQLAWQKKGSEGLLSKGRPGPKPALTEAKKEKVRQALLKGPQFFGYSTNIWTLKRVAEIIKRVTKVKFHPGYVWYMLGSMGWSCQKPKLQSRYRNEAAIQNWKKTAWPAIKKRGENYGPGLDF